MPQFKTREEYEAWKSKQTSEGAPAANSADKPAGFSVAKQAPRMWLSAPAAIIMIAVSLYLFRTGDRFSGCFVLALGAGIGALYLRFRMRPDLDDAELMKASLKAIGATALSHGRVSQATADELKKAQAEAKERYEKEQAAKAGKP